MPGLSNASEARPPARSYAGASADERRARRRAALLEATLDLLSIAGVDALGVKAISTRARLNDRYFYESFRDSDDALMVLNDQLIAEATAAISAAIAGTERGSHSRLRASIDCAVEFVTTDARRGRFLIESQATEALRAKRQDLVDQLAAIMISAYRPHGRSAAAEQDARLVALTVISGGLDLASMWLRGDLGIDRDRFTDFVTKFFMAATRLPRRDSAPPR